MLSEVLRLYLYVFDKTKTTVNGLDAIQFDYDYEGNRATITIFVNDGMYYTVKYRYVDSQSKQNYWNEYTKLLSSFSTK